MCIYFKNVFPNGTELQNIRSRTTRNNSSIGRMATLCPRIRAYNNYSFRPQEFNLLQDGPKIESTTSEMVVILIGCHIPYLTSNTSSPTPTFRTYLRPLLRRYFYLTSPDPFRCYATIIIVSLHFYLPLLSPVPYCPLLSPYLVTSDLHSDLHSYLQHPRIIILIIYPLVTCSDHLRITPSCPHI